jgi:hypothetical protein
MASITELSEAAQKNYPQEPASDADRWWLPAHLGGTAPTVEEADEMARRDAQARKEKRRLEERPTADG